MKNYLYFWKIFPIVRGSDFCIICGVTYLDRSATANRPIVCGLESKHCRLYDCAKSAFRDYCEKL